MINFSENSFKWFPCVKPNSKKITAYYFFQSSSEECPSGTSRGNNLLFLFLHLRMLAPAGVCAVFKM